MGLCPSNSSSARFLAIVGASSWQNAVDDEGTGRAVELDKHPPVTNAQPQLGTAGELA